MKKLLGILLLAGTTFLAGCGSSNDGINEISGQQGNPVAVFAPVCADDTYNASSNQTLTVSAANSVLANDTPNGATLTFPTASTQGGTVAGNADGSFSYTPVANFTGSDSFTYTLTNSAGTVTCTVNITVVAVNGFFVDAANGDDGTGSFTNGLPFATIQAAVTTAGTNQDIVVRPGTYTGNVTLLDGQRLLGSGSSLINPQGAVRPVLNLAGITLADGNTVDFIRIQNTPGDAITGNGVNGATISSCEIADLTANGSGIEDDFATGSWTISNNVITNVDSIGINFAGEAGDNLVAIISGNSITGSGNGAVAFSFVQTGTVRAQLTGNTMTGTQNVGATFEAAASGSSDICLDITGNTNDDTYLLSQRDTATTRVEQLSQLTAINSGGADVMTPGGSNPPTEINDGDCMF